MFNRQSLGAVCANILAATLPFITLGLLGESLVLYISIFIGVVSLTGLLICTVLKRTHKVPYVITSIIDDLSLPYAITLSSLILKNKGIDFVIGLWVALILCVLILISKFADNHKNH